MRRFGGRRWRRSCALPALLVLLLVACNEAQEPGERAGTTLGTQPGASNPTGTLAPSATNALVPSLPDGCPANRVPAPSAVIAFAAGGRAWAVAPDDPASLTCLFAVSDPGFFSWGPRGDRVLLSGLEVRGVGSPASRTRGAVQPAYFSWSRPTGTTVIFTDASKASIQRADMGTTALDAITPLAGVTYGDVAYHPSGLAIGFVANTGSTAEIWMSTNQGRDAQLLVRSEEARFGHIAFAHDGTHLLYSADNARDGSHRLLSIDISTASDVSVVWSGSAPVADIIEVAGLPGAGVTIGARCQDHRAVYAPPGRAPATSVVAVPDEPTRLVGRLDAERFVVAVGGCGGSPADLYSVSVATGARRLLASGVQAAALRQAEPTPPPPLPPALPRSPFA